MADSLFETSNRSEAQGTIKGKPLRGLIKYKNAMKFGKSLMATAFIGYATSVEIGDKAWNALDSESKGDVQAKWNLWYQ